MHPAALAADAAELALGAAKAGEGKAFALLVQPHLAQAFRLAARKAGNRAVAEEAAQEALLIVLRELHRCQDASGVRALLFGAVLRTSHTLRRSEWRRATREERAEPPVPTAEPEAELANRELALRLQAALDRLPERRRDAVLLRLDAGLTAAEMALALDTTEQAARQLVYEGTKALRAFLAEEEGPHA